MAPHPTNSTASVSSLEQLPRPLLAAQTLEQFSQVQATMLLMIAMLVLVMFLLVTLLSTWLRYGPGLVIRRIYSLSLFWERIMTNISNNNKITTESNQVASPSKLQQASPVSGRNLTSSVNGTDKTSTVTPTSNYGCYSSALSTISKTSPAVRNSIATITPSLTLL